MASESFLLLLEGRIFSAATTMYQSVFGMWFIAILFIVFKGLLYFRTKNSTLGFATTILFLGAVTSSSMLIGVGTEFLDSPAFRLCVTIAIFEFAAVLYGVIWKR